MYEAVLQQVSLGKATLAALEGQGEQVGVRLVEAYLDVWENERPASITRALFRTALGSEESLDDPQEVIFFDIPSGAQLLPGLSDPKSQVLPPRIY